MEQELLKIAKPILFSTPMVKAVLDGTKTMTRRDISPPPRYIESSGCWYWKIPKSKVKKGGCTEVATGSREWWEYLSSDQLPYQVGDILWVRETWAKISDWTDVDPGAGIPDGYIYKADWDGEESPKWRPSRYMPKAAARIFLEVTSVRGERVQDITEEDVKKEGFYSKEEFIKSILIMYPECTKDSWMWVIEFERVEV